MYIYCNQLSIDYNKYKSYCIPVQYPPVFIKGAIGKTFTEYIVVFENFDLS